MGETGNIKRINDKWSYRTVNLDAFQMYYEKTGDFDGAVWKTMSGIMAKDHGFDKYRILDFKKGDDLKSGGFESLTIQFFKSDPKPKK